MQVLLRVVVVAFLLLISICTYKTVTFTSLQCKVDPHDDTDIHFPATTTDATFVHRFSRVLQIPTISYEDTTKNNLTKFEELHALLRELFPKVHAYLDVKVINKYSLVMRWDGQDKDKKPIMLYAHMDVVPVDDADEWKHPPFSGKHVDGSVWGRGAVDSKHQLMGILEAVEALLAQQYKPQRTFYLAFGHDEEILGYGGAKQIASYLLSQNIKFEYIIDEGMFIFKPPVFPGLDKNMAIIGIAEKGYLSLELSVNGSGGHSSVPPKHTVIGTLSAAITRLENNPHPPSMMGPGPMFNYLGREMSFPMKSVWANIWMFEWLLFQFFSNKPTLNSLIRTTTAVTIFESGIKMNVLPKSARAVVNHRVSPHQTLEEVLELDRKAINDPSVNIKVIAGVAPSPISDVEGYGFKIIQHTILQLFQGTVIAPGLMSGNTDTQWFWDLSPNIYRFCPVFFNTTDIAMFHGRNERLLVSNYKKIIEFYFHLIRNSDTPHQ